MNKIMIKKIKYTKKIIRPKPQSVNNNQKLVYLRHFEVETALFDCLLIVLT